MNMEMIPYLASTVLCAIAYAAMGHVATRERLAWPMLYATWCAMLCILTVVVAPSPEFRTLFSREIVPVAVVSCAAFSLAELVRHLQGLASPAETYISVALISGVAIGLIGAKFLDPGYVRVMFQTAAVVVPIAIVIGTLGARPLPEPIVQPTVAISHFTGEPVPEVAR